MRRNWLLMIILTGTILLNTARGATQQTDTVQGSFFLIDNIQGEKAVSATIQGATGRAEQGERLKKGDSIRTLQRGRATLVTSDRKTTIKLGTNTTLEVQQVAQQGNVWYIRVYLPQGQITISERGGKSRFITAETRTLTVAPRGTEFGITVDPSGKTGVVTSEGSVVTEAEGKAEIVNKGFQNLTLPGEPPSKPIRFTNDKRLQNLSLSIIPDDQQVQKLKIKGKVVDPINLLSLAGELQETARDGQFDVILPLASPEQKVESIVITPLGEQDRRLLWSQVCKPLLDAESKETKIRKTVSGPPVPFSRTNWDTDFKIPENQSYQRFWVKVDSQEISNTDIEVYLKYKNGSHQRFLAQRDVDKSDIKYALALPSTDEPLSQVNVRIGDLKLISRSYIVSAFGCNDSFSK